jgi:hypothetical protein
MSRKSHFFASDLHGIARLAADAATAWVPSPFARFAQDVVYAAISCGHSLAEFVIHGIAVPYGPYHSSYERESAIAALNGILGDHLAESANPLAIPMRLRRDGKSMAMEKSMVTLLFATRDLGAVVGLRKSIRRRLGEGVLRATMRIAPEGPQKDDGFKSRFFSQVFNQADVPFTSSNFFSRKTSWVHQYYSIKDHGVMPS